MASIIASPTRMVACAARASAEPRLWLWVAAALALAHAWIILASPLPPLHDYAGHLARAHIMVSLEESEFLQRYYDYEWRFRHNIGADLIIFALAQVMPIEMAGRLLVAAIPALTLWGLAWVRLKAHGRIDSLILLPAPFVMSTWFGWGFLNFCLSIAMALLAFAAWLEVRHWPLARRSGVLLVLGLVVWLTHLSGWVVLGILVFAWEVAAAIEGRRRHLPVILEAVVQAGLRCLPLAAPLIPMALAPGGGPIQWEWSHKLSAPLQSLDFTWYRLDRYCVLLLALMGGAAFVLRLTRVSTGLALAAILLLAAYLLSPMHALGATGVDVRLIAPLAMIAAAALAWRHDANAVWRNALIALITLGAGAVTLGRFAYTTIAFQHYHEDIVRNLALIEPMPRGARVLSIVVDGLRGGQPPLTFLPAMSVVRRDAFSNSQWEEDAGHTLVLKYWHEQPAVVGGETTVRDLDEAGNSTGALDRLIEAEPLQRFDYVWIINSHRAAPPHSSRIEIVGETERTAVYRVVR